MAGMGPPPKHSSVRARTNKKSTAAKLESDATVEIPELPDRYELDEATNSWVVVLTPWHPMTVAWWEDIWPSPMAAEWHESDVHGLFRLAELVDVYWASTDLTKMLKAATEIRLSGQPYGLSPLDRRRLEWTIESTKKAQADGRAREGHPVAPVPAPTPGQDPRLYVV